MEEKGTIKISLSTFFLIIAIIAICVMGFFIYKLNDDKIASTDQLSELKNKISQLENNKLKTYEESTTSQTTSKESNIQKYFV